MNPLDTLQSLDWSDPKVKIGAGAVGAVAAYLFWQGHKEAKSGNAQDAALPVPQIPDTFGTTRQPGTDVPGVIGSVGSYPVPGPTVTVQKTPKPGNVFVTGVDKSGKAIVSEKTLVKDAKTCPPGYVRVLSTGGHAECVAADQRTTPERYAGSIPLPKTTKLKNAGGDVPMSAMNAYVGKTGGVFPAPMPITAARSYTVAEGDTPGSIARKVYGGPHWASLLVNKNGPLADMRVGDRLDV